MGISVRVLGHFPERGALISNHLGYLDIFAYAALHRVVFVSKTEMRDLPLIGWMTTMAGTVYVERGRGGSALQARAGIQAAADAGIPIVFFPEGTTSNGDSVIKFHTGILDQVRTAGEPVTAAFIRYGLNGDNGPEIKVQDDVCWWGDVPLFAHVFRLLSLRGLEVSIKIADEPISFSPEAINRKIAALEARAAVMEIGGVRDAVAAG